MERAEAVNYSHEMLDQVISLIEQRRNFDVEVAQKHPKIIAMEDVLIQQEIKPGQEIKAAWKLVESEVGKEQFEQGLQLVSKICSHVKTAEEIMARYEITWSEINKAHRGCILSSKPTIL